MKLYTKDATGATRVWEGFIYGSDVVIQHGIEGGAMQEQRETITEGKQGRDIYGQAKHRLQSRISKQLDKGYVEDRDQLAAGVTNTLGLLKPMLAQKLGGDLNWPYFYVQQKFNGHRCLIHSSAEGLVAYSRNGKIIKTIPHILERIDIPKGITVDGELYCHGEKFQTISSWAKREQINSLRLEFRCYDLISTDAYKQRLDWLSYYMKEMLAPTHLANDLRHVNELFRLFRDEGYEGAILRHPFLPYEDGKRSKSLIKLKETEDAEFTVLDIIPSKDGWGILVCALPNGTFRVSAPGTHVQKTVILRNKEKYIGRKIRVEYYETTAAGVPFHPVALHWHEEL